MKKFLIFLLTTNYSLLTVFPAFAHVSYVIPESDFSARGGSDAGFLLAGFSNPFFNLSVLIGAIVFFALVAFFSRQPFWKKEFSLIKKTSKTYGELIPWMIRLSLGIALIGAGVSSVLISPAVSASSFISYIEIVVGFCILAGFMLSLAGVVAFALFFLALVYSPTVIGNLDFAALAFAFLTYGVVRPGIDDLFNIPHLHSLGHLKEWVPFMLRLSVGGSMMFLALYEKFLNPHASAFVVELFNLQAALPFPLEMWVAWVGVIEFMLGLFLVIGFHVRLFSTIAFLLIMVSFFVFREAVYAHITLFGAFSILFVTGAGKKLALDNIVVR